MWENGVILSSGSFGFDGIIVFLVSEGKYLVVFCWDCDRFLFCIGLNLGYSFMSMWLNELKIEYVFIY